MPRAITIVPKPPKLEQKKRVAAYARVSSGKDAMLHSLSAQVSYYSDLIQSQMTGSMSACTLMKPRPAQRNPEQIFRGLSLTAVPEKSIW